MRLAIFDLDHTLLSGDSDVLWLEFLVDQGEADPALLAASRELAARYAAGTVTPSDFCTFYAAPVAGRSAEQLRRLRERYLAEVIRPRIPADARDLLRRHREAGDCLVLTTATSRLVSEGTAAELGVDAYLCTELEVDAAGRYTGRIAGEPNMRVGKVEHLRRWMSAQGLAERALRDATFYSDSINDLALLSAVGRPVVVDPDARLAATAMRKGWAVLHLDRRR